MKPHWEHLTVDIEDVGMLWPQLGHRNCLVTARLISLLILALDGVLILIFFRSITSILYVFDIKNL